jgi:hypothetical protein
MHNKFSLAFGTGDTFALFITEKLPGRSMDHFLLLREHEENLSQKKICIMFLPLVTLRQTKKTSIMAIEISRQKSELNFLKQRIANLRRYAANNSELNEINFALAKFPVYGEEIEDLWWQRDSIDEELLYAFDWEEAGCPEEMTRLHDLLHDLTYRQRATAIPPANSDALELECMLSPISDAMTSNQMAALIHSQNRTDATYAVLDGMDDLYIDHEPQNLAASLTASALSLESWEFIEELEGAERMDCTDIYVAQYKLLSRYYKAIELLQRMRLSYGLNEEDLHLLAREFVYQLTGQALCLSDLRADLQKYDGDYPEQNELNLHIVSTFERLWNAKHRAIV